MPKEDTKKSKQWTNRQHAASLLREIADGLERGEVHLDDFDAALPKDGRVKIKLKAMENGLSLKLSVRPPASVDQDAHGREIGMNGKPSYQNLKRDMKGEWNYIVHALRENRLPSLDELRHFHEEAMLMITYPGKGDEYFEEFKLAVDDLLARVENDDLGGAQEAMGRIKDLRSRAHRKYA